MVRRFDIGSLRKPEKTPQGFLRVDAYLTRTGIFEYRTPAGTRRELRRDADVFASRSLESFSLAPVTDDHPPEMLSPENAREYQRGQLGESVRRDGEFVRAPMLIVDASLIAKMEAGKLEVSCGYTCDLDETPGTFNGQRYDAVQTNIRGNHVAVVERGRAGSACSVRMDSDAFDGFALIQERGPMDEKVKELEAKLAVAVADNTRSVARADAAETALAQTRKTLAELEAAMPSRVKARVSLEKQATDVLGDETKLDDMTDRDIKIAVVEKLSGAKLDAEKAKNDVYVEARYDGALEKGSTGLENARAAAVNAGRSDAVPSDIVAASVTRKKASELWKAPIPGAATK